MILNTKSGMIASGTVGSNNGTKTTKTGKTYCTFSIAAARRTTKPYGSTARRGATSH